MSAKRELITIQTENKLNKVYSMDEKGPGNANHTYLIDTPDEDIVIHFQKGPRKEIDSQHGALDVDLLEIVRDRLTGFQSGDFACEENAKALTAVEDALIALNERVMKRAKAGTLGKNIK